MDPATARSSSNSWTIDELLLAAARRGPSEKTATTTAHSSSEVIDNMLVLITVDRLQRRLVQLSTQFFFMNNTGLSYAREGDFV